VGYSGGWCWVWCRQACQKNHWTHTLWLAWLGCLVCCHWVLYGTISSSSSSIRNASRHTSSQCGPSLTEHTSATWSGDLVREAPGAPSTPGQGYYPYMGICDGLATGQGPEPASGAVLVHTHVCVWCHSWVSLCWCPAGDSVGVSGQHLSFGYGCKTNWSLPLQVWLEAPHGWGLAVLMCICTTCMLCVVFVGVHCGTAAAGGTSAVPRFAPGGGRPPLTSCLLLRSACIAAGSICMQPTASWVCRPRGDTYIGTPG
jgi:hypothetical protein